MRGFHRDYSVKELPTYKPVVGLTVFNAVTFGATEVSKAKADVDKIAPARAVTKSFFMIQLPNESCLTLDLFFGFVDNKSNTY